jgi:hypothetical protein
LIALIAQQLQPINEIEKAWLPPHAFAPNPSNPMESEMPPIDQVFRTVQVEFRRPDDLSQPAEYDEPSCLEFLLLRTGGLLP